MLDLHAEYLYSRTRLRRNGNSTLDFMKAMSLAYPKRVRIYCIRGEHCSPSAPAIRKWAAANNVELVPTPTYVSYLNRIEVIFDAIDEFVCKNADYLDRDVFTHALADGVRHCITPAERERRKLEAARRLDHRAAKTTAEPRLAA